MQESDYAQIRTLVQPGDVVAFAGNSFFSKAIRFAGGANVSHVGIVATAATAGAEPMLTEATVDLAVQPWVYRVTTWSLAQRHPGYDGRVWWLPLDAAVRARLDVGAVRQFLTDAEGQLFDVPAGLRVVLRDLYQLVIGRESQKDLATYFCSELVAQALVRGGVVPAVDPDDVGPGDLCRWQLYGTTYHYLRKPNEPDAQEIRGYNTRRPGTT